MAVGGVSAVALEPTTLLSSRLRLSRHDEQSFEWWSREFSILVQWDPIADDHLDMAIRALGRMLDRESGVNWAQVRHDIDAIYWAVEPTTGLFADGSSRHSQPDDLQWFCEHLGWARGKLEERMSPSELRHVWDEEKEHAATERLRRYFFGGLWEDLSPRARAALVNADRLYFSHTGRIEAAFNELRIAVEELCWSVVWEPLQAALGLDSSAVVARANTDRGRTGSVQGPDQGHYAWACQHKELHDYLLRRRGIRPEDVAFLRRKLQPRSKQFTA